MLLFHQMNKAACIDIIVPTKLFTYILRHNLQYVIFYFHCAKHQHYVFLFLKTVGVGSTCLTFYSNSIPQGFRCKIFVLFLDSCRPLKYDCPFLLLYKTNLKYKAKPFTVIVSDRLVQTWLLRMFHAYWTFGNALGLACSSDCVIHHLGLLLNKYRVPKLNIVTKFEWSIQDWHCFDELTRSANQKLFELQL